MTLIIGQGQTRNVAQSPLHHMTYAPAKFEAAMSNGLGGNSFTRTIWSDLDPREINSLRNVAQYPLHQMPLCICKVWSCYVQRFRRKCIYKKYLIWSWTKVKVTWNIALYITWPMYLQSLKLLRPMVKEMHYQEMQGAHGHTKYQYPRHHVTYAPAKFDIATTHG